MHSVFIFHGVALKHRNNLTR